VTDLSVKADLSRDASAPSSLSFDDLQIEAEAVLDPVSGSWRVCLSIRQELPRARNPAYSFAISLLGSFRASPDYPAKRAGQLVQTNGPSVLYGAAREVLRTAMSAGPYPPILLPTAWFHVPPPEPAKAPAPGTVPVPSETEVAATAPRRAGGRSKAAAGKPRGGPAEG
jgi:preprotein translocase subunit SecB